MAGLMNRTRRPVGVFATHRGKTVLYAGLGLMALAFLLMMLSGALADGQGEEQAGSSSDPSVSQEANLPGMPGQPEPEVEAVNHDPFAEALAAQAARGDSDPRYQQALDVAKEAAAAYGTYRWQQSPGEYVKSVPHLDREMAKALTTASKDNWGALGKDKVEVTSRTGAGRAEPQVTTFDPRGGEAVVVVPVVQRVHDRSGTTQGPASYTVTMAMDPDDPGASWSVVSVEH